MRRLLWRVIGAVVLALAAIGSFNMALWVADRDPPVHYTSARALATFVRQGETIGVQFDVFRERVCPADIKRWLYDSAGNRHAIPTFTTGLELLAGREVYERTITIPLSAEPGRAVYQVVLDYECNPLQRILSWPVRVESPPIGFVIRRAREPTLLVPPFGDG